MIESSRASNRHIPSVDRAKQPEFRPEIAENQTAPDPLAASVASSIVATALRPPELHFDHPIRLGSARFENQAIASMDMIKSNSSEATLNSLSALVVNEGADIDKNGSKDAKRGLQVIDNFLANNAVFLNMRTG